MATPLTPTAKVVPIVAPDMNDELQTQQQQHRRQRATSTRNVPAPLLECVSKRVQVISPDRQTLTPPPESTQHETTQNSKELLGSRRSSGSTPTSMTPRQLQATTTTTTGTQSPFGQHNNGVRMGWLEKYSLGRGPFSAFMRNWKRRYVVADHHGLKYYKSDKAFNAGKSPLGHVPFHGARSLQSVDDGSVRLFANITREMHDAAMRPATPKTGQVHTTPITTTSSSPSSSPHTTPTPSHVAAANGQQGNNGYVYFGLQFYECQHRYMLLFRTVDPREREAWRHFLSFFVPEGGRQQCTPQSSRRSSPAPRSTGAQALCESPIVKMEFAKARRKVLNWDDGTAAAFPTPFAGDGSPKDDPTCSTESSRNQTPVQQQHTSLNVLESDDGDDGDDDDDDSPSNRNGGSNIINDSESVHYAWLDDSVSQRGVNTASTPTPVVTQRPAFPFAMPVPHQQQQQRGSPAPSPSAHQHHHQQFSTQNAHFHHHHFATVTPTVSPRRLHRMTPTVSREALDFL